MNPQPDTQYFICVFDKRRNNWYPVTYNRMETREALLTLARLMGLLPEVNFKLMEATPEVERQSRQEDAPASGSNLEVNPRGL
jgi:phage terminase small subunit